MIGLWALSWFTACGAEEFIMLSEGTHVNIRARPDTASEVVAQLDFEEEVVALSLGETWVEILPPTGVCFYVHTNFVENGKVKVRELNVRAGPGLNYSVVGSMARKEPVQIEETFSEWFKIKPPPGTSLWVSTDLLRSKHVPAPPPEPEPLPEPAPPPEPRVVPVPVVVAPVPVVVVPEPAPVVEPAPPPAPPGLDLVPLQGQGQIARRRGVVKAYSWRGRRPSRFHLMIGEGRRAESVCYLYEDAARLKPFVNQTVSISGRDYWVQGQSLPVMVPSAIQSVKEVPVD